VRFNELQRNSHNQLRKLVLEAYGNRCACCGEAHPEFLAIDHIHGCSGKQRLPTHRLYRMLRDLGYPKDEFRLLCHNCNQSRGYYGYCPHEEQRVTALEAQAHTHG